MAMTRPVASGSSTVAEAPSEEQGGLMAGLAAASRIVDDRLQRDERVQERLTLEGLLHGNSSSDYIIAPSPAWSPVVKQRTIPYPEDMLNELDYASSRTMMGIFPEIDRAWMTQDSRLWLWDYLNPTSYDSCDFVQDVIVSLALTVPRPGVFNEKIQHVLVLCTPQDVSLVGLSASSASNASSIEGHFTDLSCKTDGVLFTAIASHKRTGRIFLAGSPSEDHARRHGGDLFELTYSQKEGWFSDKTRLVNHSRGGAGLGSLLPSWITASGGPGITMIEVDSIRHLLYVVAASGAIRMYTLGSDGNGAPIEVAVVANVLREAQALSPAAGAALDGKGFEIVSLDVVGKVEGGSIGLVATTQSGARLFFSHTKRGYGSYYQPVDHNTASNTRWLGLVHVRLPPRPQGTASVAALAAHPSIPYGSVAPHAPSTSSGHTAFFNNIAFAHHSSSSGLYFAANAVQGIAHEEDIILVTCPEVGIAALGMAIGHQPSLIETAGSIEVEGRTKGLAEVTKGIPDGLELATQTSGNRRVWIAITSGGLHVIARQRPVDLLGDILENMSGREQELAQFWEGYGRDQACSMCLILAAHDGSPGVNTSTSPSNHVGRSATSEAANQARRLFYELSGKPEAAGQAYKTGGLTSPPPGPAVCADNKVVFSGRHEGIALYLARLLKPIWKTNVTRTDPKNPARQIPNFIEKTLVGVQIELSRLQQFIDSNQQLLLAPPDARAGMTDQSIMSIEQASISGLRGLLTQAIEAISFVLLLADYSFGDIIAACSSQVNSDIKSLTFRDFLTSNKGRGIAREIVRTLINIQIGRSQSVDVVSEILQQRCGSFCSSDDVLLYKAIESLNRAKETGSSQERWECLRECLRLFAKGAKHVSEEQLQSTCQTFDALLFFEGSINLAQECALAWDPDNVALEYWQDGQPEQDARKTQYDTRQKCYMHAKTALKASDDLLNESITQTRDRRLLPEQAEVLWQEVRQSAFRSRDELFHYALYDWLLDEESRPDQLIELQTPFLEKYLSGDEQSLAKLDLLWRLYVQSSRRLDAAKVLGSLAETTAFDIPVSRRCEFLSAAVANAKASPDAVDRNEELFTFISDLEEKLDVAKVQIDLEGAVRDIPEDEVSSSKRSQISHMLQSRLLSVTELYNDIAQPLELLESSLYIFHVSDHRDPELIRETWEGIVSQADRGRAGSAQGVDSVASKVTELGRRFYPSEVAFPLSLIVNMLEVYALGQGTDNLGWVPKALQAGNIPWQTIWESMDELFQSRSPPWHNQASANYLVGELAVTLDGWLGEVATTRSGWASNEIPAARLSDSIARYLTALKAGGVAGSDRVVEQLAARLRAHQKLLHTRF